MFQARFSNHAKNKGQVKVDSDLRSDRRNVRVRFKTGTPAVLCSIRSRERTAHGFWSHLEVKIDTATQKASLSILGRFRVPASTSSKKATLNGNSKWELTKTVVLKLRSLCKIVGNL